MDSEIKNLFRIGTVCDLSSEGQQVRVNFDDLGTVSPLMQVPAFGALGDDYFWMPEIGEQVMCMFMPTGNAEGYVLFSVRGSSNSPKFANNNKRYIAFSDGGLLEYDKASGTLTINAANIKITGDIDLTGGLTSSKDVVADGISLDNHVHGGIEPGGGKTGSPQ